MDARLLQLLNDDPSPTLGGLMVLAATLGPALAPLAAIVLLWRGRGHHRDPISRARAKERRVGWALIVAIALTLMATLVFQLLVQRSRPEGVRLLLATLACPSFPSGHTSLLVACAVVLTLALGRWRIKSCAGRLTALAWLLTALVVVSRRAGGSRRGPRRDAAVARRLAPGDSPACRQDRPPSGRCETACGR
ncbi:MAG: hypothetical protein CSA65_07690 [Proteobacteria bacterium]|nr:MAG: hypothetical protein CSA65_07690 [Pseudomonadota bacterium]